MELSSSPERNQKGKQLAMRLQGIKSISIQPQWSSTFELTALFLAMVIFSLCLTITFGLLHATHIVLSKDYDGCGKHI